MRRLFDDYFKSLSAFAFEYTNDSDLATEIVQDCFVELWSSRAKLTHTGNLKSYLYTMVRNDCINVKRKKQPKTSDGLPSESSFELNFIKWETIRILYDAIAELPPQSRTVIDYSLNGLKNQEIADLMGLSLNTVQTLKQRAYKKLRVALKEHYYLLFLISM